MKREAGEALQGQSGAAPATVSELSQVFVPLRFGVGRRFGREIPLASPYTDLRRHGTCCGGQCRCGMTGVAHGQILHRSPISTRLQFRVRSASAEGGKMVRRNPDEFPGGQ